MKSDEPKNDQGSGAPAGSRSASALLVALEAKAAASSALKRSTYQATRGDPHVVSVPEAAAILGISKDLAYDLARRGELPGALQLGRRWRVSLIKLRAAVHGPEDGATEHAG